MSESQSSPNHTVPAPRFRIEFPVDLPISARAPEIVELLGRHQVLILAGETGSGKTTQIPKMCLAAGGGTRGQIACTQPRRVAALSVSRRVAEELNVTWGREVGCKIRFDDRTGRDTVVKFMTDGMLLAEVQSDPLLRAYDTIILDEAHERSLNIDFLLGHLRNLRFKRPELRIVVTSATIDTEVFSKAFDDAPIVQVSGRTFPVEVIYAPLDQLGSDSAEGDEPEARAEALHYVDGAVEAVERILSDREASGDILVFMPAERDIREACELLEGRHRQAEVIPLFGRLSQAEQQRIFATSQRRKIIVATNIAETSLTLPGIRFVVDTGLARVSRYVPAARTRRLPIEAVAQSSCDQRKGRAGRVAEGVCIRLYSEEDYNARPRFAQPEIQRANLADVILRMKAFGLGDIERFPFINMPAVKSIRAGYALLEELGAIVGSSPADDRAGVEVPAPERHSQENALRSGASQANELTPLGRELARLPVDPTVGRMIFQAREERALHEVLVIAAGLSIQDPRERPMDAREKADAAHRRFVHPDSDFLTLLAIWETFHDELERLSQARLRRFCRDHFLSYTRIREWRDIYAQLLDVLVTRKDFKMSSVFDGVAPADRTPDKIASGSPGYRAIHRSILSGLLGNIAARDEEAGGFRASHDRRIAMFPGSALHVRDEPRKKPADARQGAAKAAAAKAPRWIMAAEIMETSRLYARTAARLDPAWALELGRHLLKVSHSEPFWNVDAGRVMVKQRTRLYGLEMENRAVSYGKINPAHATEIFIREALVNDVITWPLDFLAHNREVRDELEHLLTRARDTGFLNLDEALYRFYADRLQPGRASDAPEDGVSAVQDLVALVRERRGRFPRFLMLAPEDLRDPASIPVDEVAFPAALPLGQSALPLSYTYRPGQPDDGVTLDISPADAARLTPIALDWAVPGHLALKVEHYLSSLPKEARRLFVPLAETVKQLAAAVAARDRLTDRREALPDALAACLNERFPLRVDPSAWAQKPLPAHLCVRIRVVDEKGRELFAARELDELARLLADYQRAASAKVAQDAPTAWSRAREKWEKPDQMAWTFGEKLPERVEVCVQNGLTIYAYPALKIGTSGVALRLARDVEEAAAQTRLGLGRLLELELRHELAFLHKELRGLRELGALLATYCSLNQLTEDVSGLFQRWLCAPERVAAPTQTAFSAAVAQARHELRTAGPKLCTTLREVFTLRAALEAHPAPYPTLASDLAQLLPKTLLREIDYARLQHLPRYLKALKLRAERWRQSPAKEAERSRALAPWLARQRALPRSDARYWLVEEYRVSLFAQELGTAEAVSPQRLEREFSQAGGVAVSSSAAPIAPPKSPAPPISVLPVSVKKGAPLKSLGALGDLFRK
ncbi:MAG: ATP-dependent RNA helicase HrpA [Verrucomicrobia bacterium]|nr:ATP-dependent RNA helicase HrpA [Verrucomicrobiota bacterium]